MTKTDETSRDADSDLHVAIDLGAGSGRLILGRLGTDALATCEVHRFPHPVARGDGHLRWDAGLILREIETGLRRAAEAAREMGGEIRSLGVDSWGVDYGLLDETGALVEQPVCYRDERTDGVMERLFERMPRAEIFEHTGLQFLALNTLVQLYAHAREGLPVGARRLLMVPDLFHHFLGGRACSEYTDASTTQLLDVRGRAWDAELFRRLDLPLHLMADIVPAGTDLGSLRGDLQRELGLGPVRIVAPATHDTASAVVGTPLSRGWAYISSGTWSLVGVERDSPLVTSEVARLNFTNEGGAYGTIRFLKNMAGLWLLESCRKEWQEGGETMDYATLLARVAQIPGFPGFVDPDDPRFFNPKSMGAEIQAFLAESGQTAPSDPVVLAKIILDSLAARYVSIIGMIETLTGARVPGIHIVGGGSQNAYLDQATADATGVPVEAGPAEATSIGNLLVQGIAHGRFASLREARVFLAQSVAPARYEPRAASGWNDALRRYRAIEARRGSR